MQCVSLFAILVIVACEGFSGANPLHSTCPDNFAYDATANFCYKHISRHPETWSGANRYCRSMGPRYRLAVLNTMNKFYIVRNLVDKVRGSGNYHIWLNGQKIRNHWLWAATNQHIDPHIWRQGQPSGDGTCVNMFYTSSASYSGKIGLNDAPCSFKAGFLCEVI